MPAINVARTDTFEQQRVKINEIGSQLFAISAGGSDLATGNLKIGDGTRPLPSLAFDNEPSLGFYRPENGVLGFVYNSKKLANLTASSFVNFIDVELEKNVIATGGLLVSSGGSNYDAGSYSGVFLFGGTGRNATGNIVVTEFTGTVTEDGEGYTPGTYTGIALVGGSSSGTAVNFDVEGISGTITDGGSGYDGSFGLFNNVPLQTLTGSGAGARADISVVGGTVISGTITPGSGYDADFQFSAVTLFNVPTTTYTVTSVSNPGTPPPNEVYQINGVTQDTLTLIRGNTYRFDVSDSSMSTHPLVFQQTDGNSLDPLLYSMAQSGSPGTAGAFMDFIISPDAPTGNIKYNCAAHDGMGAAITVTTGSVGQHGTGMVVDIETNAGGQVSTVTEVIQGSGYKTGDVLEAAAADLPTGAGFQYTLGTFTYNGVVSDVNITTQGSGYETGDTVGVLDSDIGGAGGSGFEYAIQSNPSSITNLVFDTKGSSYQVGETLTFPVAVSTTAYFRGIVQGVSATLGAGTTLTLASTANIIPGMSIIEDPLGTGALTPATTVASVDSPTQITLSDPPTTPGATTLDFSSSGPTEEFEVDDATGILPGSPVTVNSGGGTLDAGTTVSQINGNIVTLSAQVTASGVTNVTFTPPFGVGSPAFEFEIQNLGEVESISVDNPGISYEETDTLTVNAFDLVSPISIAVTNASIYKIDFATSLAAGTITESDRVTPSSDGTNFYDVLTVKEVGGNIDYIIVAGMTISSGDDIQVEGSTTDYTTNTATLGYRYLLDGDANPSITLYSGNTYTFDLSDGSNSSHVFALSTFRDGIWGPSLVENITADVTAGSKTVTVSSSAGILPGMAITVNTGSGIPDNTTVESVVNATTITISTNALITSSGLDLTIRGVEYTDGVVRTNNSLTIKVTDATPSLYYYCATASDTHANEGGYDNDEILLTVDLNNPKVFGSGASFVVATVDTSTPIKLDNVEEKITTTNLEATNATITDATSTNLTASDVTVNTTMSVPLINNGTTDLEVTSPNVNFSAAISAANAALSVAGTTGSLTTTGFIKTTNYFDSNGALRITGATFNALGANDINIECASNRLLKVTGSSALILPKGNTAQRPTGSDAENGAIRFNTDTDQYEGYNATTTSWSSLGGVRDLDGNTTILAEETPGANDNTLWFINDNVNSIRVLQSHISFESAKTLKSPNLSNPTYRNWASNNPVTAGEYLKFRNNLYLVITGGTTASDGTEPVDTTGNDFVNGTSTLRWHSLAVAPITFEDVSELRVGPLGDLPLRVNNDLRLADNVVSTDVSDLIFAPNTGKKTVIQSSTSLVLPAGSSLDRGIEVQGAIRFNSTDSQFEGYDGANWGSLGGVKDVDQNTFIIPETAPGANENILFFYNDNNNTLQLTTAGLDFYSIDTIRSVTTDEFEITASLLTIDNAATTLDNTRSDTTFLHSTKQFFDIGLSSGLNIDPVLRLDNQGDVYFNIGFGTGTFSGVKVFDAELKELELAQTLIRSDAFTLVKGTVDNANTIIYDSTISKGAKTTVVAHNTSTGDKEFIEFGIIDDGSDVFHTEYGKVRTGVALIDPTITFSANAEAQLNIALTSDVTNTQNVTVTIVSNVTKA